MKSVLPLICLLIGAACQSSPGGDAGGKWVELFNGANLEGWVTTGGRYDGDARWTVEQGVLTGRQGPGKTGGLIYTAEMYDDFELELEVWIDYPFDSGIFARMLPPYTELKGAQVTLDWRPGGEIGGIYSDGWLLHCPEGEGLFVRDGWNHLRVISLGEELQLYVWLNDQPLTAFQLPAGAEGYARAGRIGLQVHGGEDVPDETAVRFRGVRVRPVSELPADMPEDFPAASQIPE